MELEFLQAFKGMKTVKGHPSIYAVLAEKDGLLLTAAPKIALGGILGLSLRIRVRKANDDAVLNSESGSVFGLPECGDYDKSHNHGDPRIGTDLFVALSTVGVAPYELGEIVYENQVLGKIVDELHARVMGAGGTLSVEPAVIVEYFSEQLKDSLPNEKPKEKIVTDFPVVIGAHNIEARMRAIYQVLNPEQASAQGGEEQEADPEE